MRQYMMWLIQVTARGLIKDDMLPDTIYVDDGWSEDWYRDWRSGLSVLLDTINPCIRRSAVYASRQRARDRAHPAFSVYLYISVSFACFLHFCLLISRWTACYRSKVSPYSYIAITCSVAAPPP